MRTARRAVTLRDAIETLLHPDAAGEVWLVVAEAPSPSECARHLEEEAARRGAAGVVYIRGEVDDEGFIDGAFRAARGPLMIANPGPRLWLLLSERRSQVIRTAPCVILLDRNDHGSRDAAHIQTLAGTNVLHVSGSGVDASEAESLALLGEVRRAILRCFDRNPLLELLASDSGVSRVRLRCGDSAEVMAFDLVHEAHRSRRLRAVLAVARREYSSDPELARLEEIILRLEALPLE